MDFLKHLKEKVFDIRFGNREQVTVNRRALLDLINYFEQLDTAERAQVDTRDLNRNLQYAIEAVYKNVQCTEETLLIVMGTLGPLIKERLKEDDLKAMFRI
jgi:hypothetical protein